MIAKEMTKIHEDFLEKMLMIFNYLKHLNKRRVNCYNFRK